MQQRKLSSIKTFYNGSTAIYSQPHSQTAVFLCMWPGNEAKLAGSYPYPGHTHSNPVGPSLPGSVSVGPETQTVLPDHCKKERNLSQCRDVCWPCSPGSALLSSAGELGIRVKIHFYARTPSHPQATPKWCEDTARLPGYYREHN